MAEHRPAPQAEFAAFHVVEHMPGNVAGQQIRRELHPVALAAACGGKGSGQQGFAQTGHALYQQMAAADQRAERAHQGFLGHQHGLADCAAQLGNQLLCPAKTVLFLSRILLFHPDSFFFGLIQFFRPRSLLRRMDWRTWNMALLTRTKS